MLKYHSAQLSPSALQSLIPKVIQYAECMRSCLIKNALIVIREASEALGKSIDGYLPPLIPLLFKKAVHTNVFISEAAASALETICKRSNINKALSTIIPQSYISKGPAFKVRLCGCFSTVISRAPHRIKDLDKVIK